MSWADAHIAALKRGETVQFRPRGNSMSGRVESGQLVTVEPVGPDTIVWDDDVVLCRVAGRVYLHLVRATRQHTRTHDARGDRAIKRTYTYQIASARGRVNGWARHSQVFGRVVEVSP